MRKAGIPQLHTCFYYLRLIMRMWMIPPEFMCKQHIIGEHGEIHKFKKSFEKQYKINNRMFPIVQILPAKMKIRHDELAKYMNHKSEYILPDLSYLPKEYLEAEVDIEYNIKDLNNRCSECRKLLKNYSLLLYKNKL